MNGAWVPWAIPSHRAALIARAQIPLGSALKFNNSVTEAGFHHGCLSRPSLLCFYMEFFPDLSRGRTACLQRESREILALWKGHLKTWSTGIQSLKWWNRLSNNLYLVVSWLKNIFFQQTGLETVFHSWFCSFLKKERVEFVVLVHLSRWILLSLAGVFLNPAFLLILHMEAFSV